MSTLYACPECGCTDVEVTAWINVNTSEISGSDGPLETAWCPQCEHAGRESDIGKGRHLETVDNPKPFKEAEI